jgi:aerobic carbon-monoxide dehydrogenase medium subunit
MKPAPFEYERAADVASALSALAKFGKQAKVLAGGQSLIPMLNLRIASTERLIDVSRLDELRYIRIANNELQIGALTTHNAVLKSSEVAAHCPIMVEAYRLVSHHSVRNRGTIGGSLAHADPAADWISALALVDARAIVWTPRGSRPVAVADLIVSSFTTVLRPDELIQTIRVPKVSAAARWGFYKFSQKAGEFAHVIGGILYDPACSLFRAVIGAIETAPIVVPDAAALFPGGFGPDLVQRLNEGEVLRLLDGKNVKDAYIRRLAVVALKRAAIQAGAK